MKLRDYQAAAVQALFDWFEQGRVAPLVVVPTGGGKSIILAGFVRETLDQWNDMRFLIVTHVKELIEQNHLAMHRAWALAPTGIYSAGIGRRDTRAKVTFAGVQSIYQRAEVFGHIDVLIVDEAHLIPPTGYGMYRRLITELRERNPKMKVVGLTATPFRMKDGHLHRGDDALFDGIAYDCDLVHLIEEGWLSPVTSYGMRAEIDTSNVHLRGGEFIESELSRAAMADGLVDRAVEEIVARAEGRRSWLLFCTSIEHAESVRDAVRRHEIPCEAIFGHTRKSERERLVADYKAGRIRAMVNVNVLTTGFDAPGVDLIAMLRPTCSPGLYVQMIGRGLRRAEGKDDCLVLDFSGNIMRHGPLDCVHVRQPGKGGAAPEQPMKKCPKCGRIVHEQTKTCPGCGYEWVEDEETLHHGDKPDERSTLLRGKGGFERWDVSSVRYLEHKKPGKPDSLCVEYFCGYKREVREWVCFEHGGYARKKAESWWKHHGGHEPAPETVDLARVRIELGELLRPLRVTVDTTGDYPQLKAVRMDDAEAGQGDEVWAREEPAPRDMNLDEIPF